MSFVEDAVDLIWNSLLAVWHKIKKLVIKCINFATNILSWFKNPARQQHLTENKDVLAVVIKRKLESGDYNVVNCLFNQKTEKIVAVDEPAVSIEASELDSETVRTFGNKDMAVLT